MLVGIHEVVDPRRMSDGHAVSGAGMKLLTLVLMMALVVAPACGGGGGSSDSGVGGSPSTLSASFVPDLTSPGSNTVAMLQASKSNDVVNVWVTLTQTPNAFAAAFEVVFNNADATYLGYTKGAAFEAGGNVPNYTVDGTTNPGRIVVGVARTNGTATNITSSKAIVTLQFRVNQAGMSPVVLENGVIFDAQATPQPIANILWFAGALSGV
jgi:hypothetical protein